MMWLLIFLSWIYSLLPGVLQTSLMYLFFKINCIPKMHLKTAINFINPKVLQKVFFMAFEEMDLVKEKDTDTITANMKIIKFYYGANDDWAPASYYTKLKQDIPGVDAEMCQRKFDHSFVLKTSRDVGNMVAAWVKNKL